MTLQEDILKVLMQTRDEIRANMASKGINASGRTSESLTAAPYPGGVKLYFAAGDRAPMETLEIGRPGGAVPYNFTDIIYQWSLDKGLNWGDDKARRKIAGAVAWGKIRPFGTNRHKDPVDVYSTPVEKARKVLSKVVVQHIWTEMQTAKQNF